MRFRNNAFWWGGVYGVLLAVAFFLGEKPITAKMPPEIRLRWKSATSAPMYRLFFPGIRSG